uniref:Uncharacterized protein n=1 Tax=Romanomermis culicivorax TaxID=13658 RepID=A0A915HY30_ROMCU
PVILPTSTKPKSIFLVEVYPKKLLNLHNPVCPTNGRKFFSSPFGFTRTLIYLNHVHKHHFIVELSVETGSSLAIYRFNRSSSLSSVSSEPAAPKSIENWADCDRPSNRNLIGAATSATTTTFSTVAGPEFNYNYRPSIVNGGKKYCSVKPQPRQQLIDEIIETRHVKDLVQCSTTTTAFDSIIRNEYDAAKSETIFILVDCRFDLKHFTGALHLFNILLEDLRLFEDIDSCVKALSFVTTGKVHHPQKSKHVLIIKSDVRNHLFPGEVNGLCCKVNFVLLGADENILKMFEESDIRNTEAVDINQLHAKIAPGQFSDHVSGGERKYNAGQWDLEKFVNCCQTAAKFYIKSMKRLKVLVDENSVRILWSMPINELENRALW